MTKSLSSRMWFERALLATPVFSIVAHTGRSKGSHSRRPSFPGTAQVCQQREVE